MTHETDTSTPAGGFGKLDALQEKAARKREEAREEEEGWKRLLQQMDEKEARYREWKKSMYDESVRRSRAIFDWGRRVANHPGSRPLFGDYKGVKFYGGRHVDCQNCGKGSAELWLTGGRYFRYVERFRCPGFGPFKESTISSPEQMARKLHPDCIREAEESIQSGEVWDTIDTYLDRATF